jgi:hypothetical protein
VAGTPTGEPGQDAATAQASEESLMAWERPVPARWAPSPEMTARAVPMNETVMRTAPGEGPISR